MSSSKSQWLFTAMPERNSITKQSILNHFNSKTLALMLFAFCLSSFVIQTELIAQLPSQNQASFDEKTYNEVLDQYEAYLQSIPVDSTNEITKGIEHFKYFWKGRISDGSYSESGLFSEYLKAMSENSSNFCNINNYNPEPWSLIGPYNSSSTGTGPIETVWVSNDENTILAGSRSSGLWKSVNGGLNWTNIFDDYYFTGSGVRSISVNPSNENIIYVAASYYGGITSPYGIGVLKSIDGGISWSNLGGLAMAMATLGFDPFTLPVSSVVLNPTQTNIVYTGSRNYLFKSEDDGTSWSVDNPPLTNSNDVIFQELEYSPNSNTIFVSTVSEDGLSSEAQFFKKDNGSSIWLDLTPLFIDGTNEIKEFEIDILANGHIYTRVLYEGLFSYFKIYKSVDNGSSFLLLNISSDGIIEGNDFPLNSINGFEVTSEGIGNQLPKFYIGVNGLNYFNGTIFSNTSTAVNDIFHSSDGSTVYISNTNGLSKTETNSIILQYLNSENFPLGEYFSVSISEKDANLIIAGSSNNGSFFHLKDGWKTFLENSVGGNGVLEISNPSISYLINNNNHYRVSYNNTTEEFDYDYLGPIPGNYSSHYDEPIGNNPNFSGVGYFGGKTGFYKKTNLDTDPNPGATGYITLLSSINSNGESQVNGSFHSFAISEPSSSNVSTIYLSSGDPTMGDVSKEAFAVRKSINFGINWTSTSFPQNNTYNRITSTTTHSDAYYNNFVFLTHAGIPQYNNQKRVSLSKDNGDTWLEWSKGLLRVPVNDLAIQKSNNMVYAATDVGVYFRDATDLDQGIGWQCFSDQLPNCIVTGIEVNNCSQELIISTWGRGIWKTKLLPVDDLVINTDIDWNSDMEIYSNVKVTSGATLTITSTINMSEDKTITIEPGSYLKVIGGTITNACGRLWGGIVVEGDANIEQSPYSNQGRLALSSGATIENAYIGIRNHGLNTDGSDNLSKTGGIIQAYDSHFLNNKWDSKFLTYLQYYSNGSPKSDFSKFVNCDFIVDDQYADNGDPVARVALNKVFNVNFYNCRFEDSRSGIEKFDKGLGLYTIDASYTFTDTDPSDNIFSSVKNFQYGIQSFGIENALSSIEIKETQFDNYRGVYLNGIENAKVNLNDFNVDIYNEINGTAEDMAYGLYLDMCFDYTVEENTLESDLSTYSNPPSSMFGGSVGIVVHNLHPENDEIYNNDIKDFLVGIEAIGQNKNPNTASNEGLEILCNRFYDLSNSHSQNRTDVFITENPNAQGELTGIAQDQGEALQNPSAPAGNLFGINNQIVLVNYDNQAGEGRLNYFHHDLNSSIPNVFPTNINVNTISVTGNGFTTLEESCPSSFYDPRDEEELIVVKTASLSEIETNTNELELLVDGGSTSQLQSEVATTTDQTAYNNYLELMQNAGYISEEVLQELSAQENGFSQGMIRNVLVANPQAAKSSEVQDNLDNRSNQLPQYMRDQIDQGLTHLSPKEYLELSIAKSKRRMDKAITEAFHIYSKDTVNDRSADIVSLYSNTGDINFDYKLVAFYDENNDAVLANALLEVIDSYGLTAIEQDYHDDFVSYRTLINNWKLADKNMATLDSADITQLLEYSYLGNTISSKAMVLLKLNNKLEYNEPLNWPVEGEKSNKSNKSNKKIEDELTDYFVVYPNPAKDFVTVDYSLRDSEIDALMTISNSEGKVMVSKSLKNAQNQVLIEVSSWASGQYICTFYIGSEIQESQKIVIAK